jgi:hypothetical protein
MRRLLILIGALGATAAAQAGTPYAIEVKCPVGGKAFSHTATASYSTWGSRPDGKPYGSWQFPMPLPVCPDNGLPVYKEFSKEEVAKLEPLVTSRPYQMLREGNTPYYAAYWLMRRMGDPAEQYLWTLLQGSWEADGQPETKKRYQQEFVTGVAQAPRRPDSVEWIAMQGRAVNALRELGRFEEATALLRSLPLDTLQVEVPAEKYGESTASGLGKQVLNEEEIRVAKNRRGWLSYFKDQQVLIDRKDASSEPLEMVPVQVAIGRCIEEAATLDALAKAFCEKDEVQTQIERMKKLRAGSS